MAYIITQLDLESEPKPIYKKKKKNTEKSRNFDPDYMLNILNL